MTDRRISRDTQYVILSKFNLTCSIILYERNLVSVIRNSAKHYQYLVPMKNQSYYFYPFDFFLKKGIKFFLLIRKIILNFREK